MSAVERLLFPRFRRMTESDLDQVMEIEEDSFTTPWSKTSFRNLLGRGDANLWVAEIDEQLVGYAVLWYVLREAELGNIAVVSGWRGQGIGGRLLRWVVESARARGTERLFLEVRESNRAAQTLYERHGFVQVGVRRRYYRAPVEDARVMCLRLGRSGDVSH